LVPSIFVQLDALPLNTNGKVDRKALPAPVLTAEQEVELVLPRTPVEQTLAEIWSQVLQIEQIGIHNNFFALGGDSILSLQVIARAQQAGLRITPRQMFQHQTIAELAAVVAPISTADAEPSLKPEQQPAEEPGQPAQPATGGLTPADFPRAKLSQKDLDTLASRLGKSGKRRP
ncbi:MAG TPA: phosphopantetheine-binding protein, partial [Herpetosiphonaceae bacterium]